MLKTVQQAYSTLVCKVTCQPHHGSEDRGSNLWATVVSPPPHAGLSGDDSPAKPVQACRFAGLGRWDGSTALERRNVGWFVVVELPKVTYLR